MAVRYLVTNPEENISTTLYARNSMEALCLVMGDERRNDFDRTQFILTKFDNDKKEWEYKSWKVVKKVDVDDKVIPKEIRDGKELFDILERASKPMGYNLKAQSEQFIHHFRKAHHTHQQSIVRILSNLISEIDKNYKTYRAVDLRNESSALWCKEAVKATKNIWLPLI